MKKISIGVLGCANIAYRSMIPAILSMPNIYELRAVASRTKMKADEFASKFDCEAIESYKMMIERKDIDAIYIPLPTGLHQEWINKALCAGKHVYAEKSIAFSYKDADEMVNNAKRHNVALMEGFMFQYHKQNLKVKEMISQGAIGDIRYFTGSFGFPPFADSTNFRYDKEVGGGAIFDACGYPLRAAYYLLGDSLKVLGASAHYEVSSGTSIYGSAFLGGDNGIGASISFGFDNYYQCNYQIWGNKGTLKVCKAFTPKKDEMTKLIWEHDSQEEVIDFPPDNHFEKAMLEFSLIVENEQKRDKHYKEILQQSEALERIVNLTDI